MTKSHTPGPWEVDDVLSSQASNAISAPTWGMLATVSKGTAKDDEKEALANARLIAAAPELLEALKALCVRWKGNPDNYSHAAEIRQARAAIAKAKGGAA